MGYRPGDRTFSVAAGSLGRDAPGPRIDATVAGAARSLVLTAPEPHSVVRNQPLRQRLSGSTRSASGGLDTTAGAYSWPKAIELC
jgi:hypothetical protein